jgi:hypothetical protein
VLQVLPLVPCVSPVPAVPHELVTKCALSKLADTTLCDARSASPSWRLPHRVRVLSSHEEMTITTEMRRMIRYGSAREPVGEMCCQLSARGGLSTALSARLHFTHTHSTFLSLCPSLSAAVCARLSVAATPTFLHVRIC